MDLWLHTIIPTLFPCIVLSNILIKTNILSFSDIPLHKLSSKILGLSKNGLYGFTLGILSGYPMGAKITSDLYENQKISSQEANYLLTFINNPSPAYVIGYIGINCLENKISPYKLFFPLVFSNVLCMCFFRYLIYKKSRYFSFTRPIPISSKEHKKETSPTSSLGAIIDASIMHGFETLTHIGGQILIFSVLTSILNYLISINTNIKSIIFCLIELTTGSNMLKETVLPLEIKYIILVSAVSFGGLCVLTQTRSVLNKELSIILYSAAKCLNLILTILFTYLLVFAKFI